MDKHRDLILLERLAAGGMAEVYRAKQLGYQGFEKVVAVKRILPQFAEKKNFKKMFVHEANLSATLEHPNIAHVYANGENKGYLYLIMEYIDGHNLRQLIGKAKKQSHKISVEMSIFVVTEILKGLEYAHSRTDDLGKSLGIVHRDISPQNVMLSYDGAVKIVDFGIARVTAIEEPKAGKTAIIGKFSYMSPEQAQGEQLDRRSDIFSAGIILWELLAGRKLYSAETDVEIIEKAKDAVVPPPSEFSGFVPAALEKIVMKALERDPRLRYTTSLEFYTDLIRYQNSKRSDFIPTDFAQFMREFFKDEIAEKRKVESQIKMNPVEQEEEDAEEDSEVTRVSINPGESTGESASFVKQETQGTSASPKETSSFAEMAGMIELQPIEGDSGPAIKILHETSTSYHYSSAPQRPLPPPQPSLPYVKIFLYTLFITGLGAAFYLYGWTAVKDLKVPQKPWAELVKLRKIYFPDKASERQGASSSAASGQSVSSAASSQ